jgi:CHAT domain-containing protein
MPTTTELVEIIGASVLGLKHRMLPWVTSAFVLLAATVHPAAAWSEDSTPQIQSLQNRALLLYTTSHYSEGIIAAERSLALAQSTKGSESTAVADSLQILAHLYVGSGSCDKAQQLHQRALSIRMRALGANHLDTAASLDGLGMTTLCLGQFAAAQPLLQRGMFIREHALGPMHVDTASSMFALGLLRLHIGDYDAALSLQKRVLEIRKATLGAEHAETARSMSFLAMTHTIIGDYAIAEPMQASAVHLLEKSLGPDHPDTARALSYLGLQRSLSGPYASAVPTLQRALAILEKSRGAAAPDTARAMSYLGLAYCNTGDFAKAESLQARAIPLLEAALGKDHPDVARALSLLGWTRFISGNYAAVESVQLRALAILDGSLGPIYPETASVLSNLAVLYIFTGSYDKAQPLLQRATLILKRSSRPDHPTMVRVLAYQAYLSFFTRDYGPGLVAARRAVAMAEKLVGSRHPLTAVALSSEAALLSVSNEQAKAASAAKRSLSIRSNMLGVQHSETVYSLLDLAAIQQMVGAHSSAMELQQRAVNICEHVYGKDNLYTARALQSLAFMHLARGATAVALPLLQRAQAINAKNDRRFLFAGTDAARAAFLHHYAERAYKDITFSLHDTSPAGRVLGMNSVLQYKGQAIDASIDLVAQLRRNGGPADRALVDKLSRVTNRLSALTYDGAKNASLADWRGRIDHLSRWLEDLERQLSGRSDAFRSQFRTPTTQRVAQKLPADAVLLEWFVYRPYNVLGRHPTEQWGAPRYVAYILRHRSVPVAIDVGDAAGIDTLIRSFRQAVTSPSRKDVAEHSRALYRKLFVPIQPHIRGAAHLLVSPDGALNLVPMAALIGEDGRYLCDHFDITYLASGRDLLGGAAATPKGRIVVIADPDFGAVATEGAVSGARTSLAGTPDSSPLVFKPLPSTATEAAALRELFGIGRAEFMQQGEATEGWLKQLERPAVLHVATHGFFLSDLEMSATGPLPAQQVLTLREHPLLRSGLALAGANVRRSGADQDGILTALEVTQLHLHGTQLVVLSACDTGVGALDNGNGIYGLRRALAVAGVRTHVTSLWRVFDESTKDFMVAYYKALLAGQGRTIALNSAQRSVRNMPGRSHPYFWATFVSVGDWTPLAL